MTENDKPESVDSPSPAVWRGLGLAAVGVLAAAVLAIALISAGLFDPRPAGDLVETYALPAVSVAAGSQEVLWLEEPVITTDFTVRLTAAFDRGEEDSGYGLLVGDSADYLAAAVSPLGYVTVWEATASRVRTHMFWQPWPHVQEGQSENEIQIDVIGEAVTIRINRELLWQGNWQRPTGATDVALYAESFGQAAQFAFHDLGLYKPGD